jgi:hypothetical protein
MPRQSGRSVSLSLARRLVGDFVHFGLKVPLIPIERRMDLGRLVAARAALATPISWTALFVRAYALVALDNPWLRRSLLRYPWERLYEHPCNVAGVTVQRQHDGEEPVFLALLRKPEKRSLAEIHAWLRHCKEAPIEEVACFRRSLHFARLPRFLRRLAWWLGVDWCGRQKARNFGTFGVSSTANLGGSLLWICSNWTTTLHCGVLEEGGVMPVRMTFDHRVLDGGLASRVLADLEATLTGPVLAELEALPGRRAA